MPLALSPDGKKLLVSISDGRGVFWQGLASLRVADLARNRITPIATMNLIRSFVFLVPMSGGAIRWTPDSRSIVYPISGGEQEKGKVSMYIGSREAEYESWAYTHL